MRIVSIVIFCMFVLNTNAQNASNPSAKATLNHTAIYVVDLEKSGNFYHDIIGLDTIPEPFHDGKHIWMKTSATSTLHIIKGADKPKEYFKNQHTCFSVSDFNGFIEKLNKASIQYENVSGKINSITKRIDGVHQIWLRDPDGYWLEINDMQ